MRILQISTSDMGGGAEKVAWNLFQAYRQRGHHSWLAVGAKRSDDAEVLVIPNREPHGRWCRFWWAVHTPSQTHAEQIPGARHLSRLTRALSAPGRVLDGYRGLEDSRFPGTWHLLELQPHPPDVVHCHNLHGGYFDLRALPWLSHQLPVILTLHDAWLLSGHCAHSFDCERWKTGCGQCPDVSIYPPIRRDATARNWQRKRNIYANSQLHVATPSRWLMNKVEKSILAPAIIERRVIPNGVDLSVFTQADKRTARAAIGVPTDTDVLLFVGHGTRSNPFKDYDTLQAALAQLAARNRDRELLLLCLGEGGPEIRLDRARIHFVTHQEDEMKVARFFQAADVYLHAAKADTFPTAILEALACGTPVVATAVGGISEQVRDEVTGFLTPQGDAHKMAMRVEQLLRDEPLRRRLAENAVAHARQRFDLVRQVDDYLTWYEHVTKRHREQDTGNQPRAAIHHQESPTHG